MKVIFIVWIIRLNVQRGGVHRIIHTLLEQLPRYGYQVYYFYTTDNYISFHQYLGKDEEHSISQSDFCKLIQKYHCNVLIGQDAVASSILSSLVASWKIPTLKYVTEYHNSILLLENVFSRQYWQWILKYNKSIKIKILACIRLLFYSIWLYRCKKSVLKNFQKNYSVADKLIVLSKYELPEIKKLVHGDISKCAVINNPLSWEKIESPNILLKKKKEVLIVSRLYNPEKRLDRALYIWKIIENKGLTDWTLRIVGAGVHESFLKSLARELDLKNVRFEGRQDSYSYYLTASLFMMTSAVEGWGLTLTESMQTGTVPIVFDSYPALKNIVTNGYDGYIIKDNDLQSYADCMEMLMTNKEVREKIALNGLESCKRFSIDKIMSQWISLIESL